MTETRHAPENGMAQRIEAAVMEHYIQTGRSATADEIASTMKCSASVIRRYFREGLVAGIVRQQEARVSHSTDYPSMERGEHRVYVYFPSRDALRGRILAGLNPAAIPALVETARGVLEQCEWNATNHPQMASWTAATSALRAALAAVEVKP